MHGGGLELALVFLLAAVIAVPLFRRFGLGAVLGYLVAGAALGPFGLRFVRDAEPVLTASEIGVVMLLFVIGLELSPSRLKVMRRPVFGAGGMQVLVSGAVLAAAVLAWSSMLGDVGGVPGWKAAAVIGFGLALSSTAVGLQLLSERRALTSPHGRLGFAVLLFQDLAAIPLLAIIPLLAAGVESGATPWLAIGKAVAAIVVVTIGGRFALRHLFRIVARTGMPEVFTGAALLTVLGAAWLMQTAGLSAGLGAFLAGVLLSDSEFRHELESQIDPFKGLLLGLFFMAVGMSIDLARVFGEPLVIASLVAVLMATKFAVLFAVGMRPGGIGGRESLRLAALLATGGEFAFVVFGEAERAGLFDVVLRDRLAAAVGVSMALTPLLVKLVSGTLAAHPSTTPKRAFDTLPDDGHPQVLIAGFGRFGQIVARLLAAHRTPFIAIEPDIDQVDFSRRFGSLIYYGDPSKPDLLRSAGAAHVKVFVIAIEDRERNLRTVETIRRQYPDAIVHARARDRRHAWELMDLGARPMRETFHSSLTLGEEVLVELGVPTSVASAHAARFREHDERLLVAQYQVRDDEDALRQSTVDARRELEELFSADVGEGVLGTMVSTTDQESPRRS